MPFYHELINTASVNLTAMTEKVIYCNAVTSIMTFVVIVTLTFSIIPLVNDAGILVNDASKTLTDLNIIIPEVKDTLQMVYRLCQYDNFTKNYGFLCTET